MNQNLRTCFVRIARSFFPRIGVAIFLVMTVVVALASSANAANLTISGTLYKNGSPAPNYTFFWERWYYDIWTGRAITTDSNGTYSVTWEDCSGVNWPWGYYFPRFALTGGGLSIRDNWDGVITPACGSFTRDLNVPTGAQDGSRYNAGGTPSNQSVGCPVDVTNGNMWFSHTDYLLPGSVGRIEITRKYNSGINVSGIFGNGWLSDYESKLVTMPSETNDFLIKLDSGTGRVVDFLSVGSSVFKSTRSGLEGQIVASGAEYVLTWKDGRTSRFSSSGQLLWQKDRNGNQTTFTYDVGNNLATITDPFGRSLSLVYTANGKVAEISDSTGTAATYAYDAATGNYLTNAIYADGSQYKYEYVTVGSKTYLSTVKDALNNVLETHAYDSSGRATTSEKAGGVELFTIDYSHVNDALPYSTVTDALGRETKYYFDASRGQNIITKLEGLCSCGGGSETTEYEYDARLNLTRMKDALFNETTYGYDTDGNRITQTDVLGTQTWTYNALGQVLTYRDRVHSQSSDPNVNTVVNTYSPTGNLLATKDALNNTTTLTYTSIGQLSTITDARNKTTTLTWDTQGRLSQVTDANNKDTNFVYDARARITGLTNALSQTTSFEYDLNNRLKKVIYPDTNFVENTYDLAGRRIEVRDPRGNVTNFAYDGAYRLTSVTDPLSHATTYGYDLMSNLVSHTDALGNVTNLEYDDFNRLKKIIYPPATTGATRLEELMTYDKLGSVKTRVDTAGRTTSYDYDTANRLIKITDALSNQTQFEYNLRSQMTKVKDALNQEYIFTYDPLGRQLTRTRAGTTETFVYDVVGNRTTRTDFNGRVTDYEYDDLNRLVTIAYVDSSDFAEFEYDDLSRLVSAVNQNGPVSRTYDNRSRLKTETDVWGKTIEFGYDAAGNRTLLNLDGSNHAAYTYDSANRLTTLTDSDDSTVITFGYDNADRLTSKTMPNGIAATYEYDGMNRLTRLMHSLGAMALYDDQYSYNPANQISQIAGLTATKNFVYDNVNRLTGVTSVSGNESYNYDAVGNRTASHLGSYAIGGFNRISQSGAFSIGHDDNGNMTSWVDSQGPVNTEPWGERGWDFENRLNLVNVDGQNVTYAYDALGRRVSRTFAGRDLRFTYDGQDVLIDDDENTGEITKYQNGPGIDNKLKLTSGSVSKYFLEDHLGSTVGLANGSGVVTEQMSYDSFGNPGNTSFGTRYQFTGREFDSFTGLQFSRARWYHPGIGRFISEDPIGFAGGDINLYGYVNNRPLMYRDPTGWFPSIGSRYFRSAHKNITERALAGRATPSQIRSIAWSNVEFDKRTQDSIFAPYHAMRRYGQTSVKEARDEANEFVRSKICTAREYASRGWNTDAMYELGKAMHTLQDAYSPEHAGFQEAWPGDLLSFTINIPHYVSEAIFPGDEAISAAEIATQDAWSYFNGTPMPADFFR